MCEPLRLLQQFLEARNLVTPKVGAPILVSVPIAVISTPFLEFRAQCSSTVHGVKFAP